MYLLDTNVFVNAKRDWYGFEFCPAFWDWLDQSNAADAARELTAESQRLGLYD